LVYLDLHQDNQAKSIFIKILDITKDTPEAKWGIAEVMRREHKLSESEKLLKEIILAEPKFFPAYISLAYIKYINFDFKDCMHLAYKVIDQGKDNVDLNNYTRAYLLSAGAKGMLAHYGGLFSKILNGITVMAKLKKAENLSPNSPAVLLGLGSFYLLAPKLAGGDIPKAKYYLERAVKIDPLFVDAYVRLAQVYRLEGNNKKYELYLKKALEIDPENELALDIESGRCRFICR
jgi:tetratricopeptide (TPR) repeat protein